MKIWKLNYINDSNWSTATASTWKIEIDSIPTNFTYVWLFCRIRQNVYVKIFTYTWFSTLPTLTSYVTWRWKWRVRKEHLKMCFQQACVWVPISTAMFSRTSMLSAWAACSRAILARPLSTDEIIDLLSVTLAGCCCCCCWDCVCDVAARRTSSSSMDAVARCSNTASQRSYRPGNDSHTRQ